MDTITEKVAYIKGLMDGMDYDKSSKEGKLFAAILDVLDDLANAAADVQDQVDAVDDDLATLEEFVYEELDDEDDDFDPCEGCSGCYGDEDLEDDDFDCDPAEYEFECPNCHETVFIDESVFENGSTIECPACGAKLEGILEEDSEETVEE